MSLLKIMFLALAIALCGAAAGCAAGQGPRSVSSGTVPAVSVTTPTTAPGSPTSTTGPAVPPDSTTSSEAPDSTTTSYVTTGTTAGEDARATVLKVVDGDTLQVSIMGGSFPGTTAGATEELRIIGIDAPEKGEDFSAAATAALERLVGSQEIELDADQDARDQYGRLLAYVFLEDGTFVDAEMLRQGLATLYIVPPNERFTDKLEQAQTDAQDAHRGIWAATKPSPVEIVTVRYNPPGDDNQELNEEYVVFRVTVAGDLKGYAVEDESGKHFDFPSHVYQKGQTVTLHSGQGTNTAADVYWGFTTSAVWNNGGDTVKVLDPQGHIVKSYTY
jgi:micrococcal nuclease